MDREELLASKVSDTLAVMGSGASLNDFSREKMYDVFADCDTFALNWYCKNSQFIPHYYLTDEQGVNGYKVIPWFTPKDYIKDVISYIAIVKQRDRDAEEWKWEDHLREIRALKKIVVKRFGCKQGFVSSMRDIDFCKDGVINFSTCLANPIHFAIWSGYKRVIFYGVDLYDCRYFWGSNAVVTLDGLTEDSKHPQADRIIKLIDDVAKEYTEIEWLVANKKSLLADVIGVYDA
jgi:hypothetical protein